MLEKLKSKLSQKVYTDLEKFVINETNFSAPQKQKFINLLETIHSEGMNNVAKHN